MTELNNWLLLALLELPEFRLQTYDAKSDTWAELRFYLNGKTYVVTIDDVSSLIKTDEKPILMDVINDNISTNE